jgi:hypothetical protein
MYQFSDNTYAAAGQFFNAHEAAQWVTGFLGKPTGGGAYTFFVPGKPGKQYLRVEQNEQVTIHEVTNMRVPLDPDVRVWARYRNGELSVEHADLATARARYGDNIGQAGVPTYIANPNTSPLVLSQALDGKVVPSQNGGTKIFAYAFDYNGGTFPTPGEEEDQEYDLSSEISGISSDMQVMALIGVDTATNELSVTLGDEQPLAYTFSKIDVAAITVPAGVIPLAALVLRDGQTLAADSFVPNSRQFDVRPWLGLAGSVVTVDAEDVTYTPTTSGDWLTPPTDVEEAADELAGRVKAIEDAGGGGIGDYILISDQKTQNTNGGTFTSGADRTRDLNTKVDPAEVASITKLAFTSGGTYEVVAGDVIEGATSMATADVFDVELTSGTWAGGDAAGNLWLNNQSGTFGSENLDVGANSNVATISGNSTNNQVRLTAGTYRINASAPVHRVNRHQAWWQNISDSSRTLLGTSLYCPAAIDTSGVPSVVRGRFTIASKKTFELQHRCETTGSTNGYGVACNFNAEVYSVVELVRE